MPVSYTHLDVYKRQALTFLAVVVIGGLVVWKVVDSGFGMKWLAEHFQKQTITESFHANVKRIA